MLETVPFGDKSVDDCRHISRPSKGIPNINSSNMSTVIVRSGLHVSLFYCGWPRSALTWANSPTRPISPAAPACVRVTVKAPHRQNRQGQQIRQLEHLGSGVTLTPLSNAA